MRRFAATLLVTVALTASARSAPLQAQSAPGESAPDSDVERTRAALREHMGAAVERGFSGVVFVYRNGEVLLHEGYGMANREDSLANAPETLFDIGSISKRFTRAAILKLEEQGKLATTDPLGKFFDDVPEDKVTITIDQMLDHEAGLAEYHDTQGDFEPMDRVDAFRAIVSGDLRFDPGTQRAYSNAGYTLLAIIVEKVTGGSFHEYVREQLLIPAGMTSTGWIGHRGWSPNDVAVGYGRRTHGVSNSPALWPEPTWALLGNGGMVSNAPELHRWIVALRAGAVLSPSAVAKLNRAARGAPYFAYAGGNDFGFVSVVLEFTDHADHIIVLSNTDGRTNAERELRPLARIAFDLPMQGEPESQAVTSGGWGLPDSPTGRGCSAFLNAIRAGTEDAARAFLLQLHPDWFHERTEDEVMRTMLELQQDLAAPELEGARRDGPGRAEIVVRSTRSGKRFRVSLVVDTVAPHRIVGLDVRPEI